MGVFPVLVMSIDITCLWIEAKVSAGVCLSSSFLFSLGPWFIEKRVFTFVFVLVDAHLNETVGPQATAVWGLE